MFPNKSYEDIEDNYEENIFDTSDGFDDIALCRVMQTIIMINQLYFISI